MSELTFDGRLQRLNREMLVHACIGHPVASILSLVGMKATAEYIHYRTLPKRARRKIPRWKVTFDHSSELILADVFFNPLAHIARAFGRYRLCNRIFFSGPWEACILHDTCNMTPDEHRWAEKRYKRATGQGFFDPGGPGSSCNSDGTRKTSDQIEQAARTKISLELRGIGEPVWSGQAYGTKPPSQGQFQPATTPSKSLFDRLVDVKFTRRGLRRIEDLIGVQIKHGTSATALRAVVTLLDQSKKRELDRLLSLAESGSNLDAK